MRDRATITTCAFAALLAACAIDASPTRAAQAPLVVAQAAADDDGGSRADGQAPMAPEPGAEPMEPAAAEPAEAPRSSEYGASRTLDPFEDDDDDLFVPAETPAPSGQGPGIVVCVAGCDAPREAAVRGSSTIR